MDNGFDGLMSSLFGKGSIKDKLMRLIKGEDICEDCPSAKYTTVASLQANELEEWASIKAESDRISKEVTKLAKEREMLHSRKKLFFGKIQLRNDEYKSRLVIRNGKAMKLECGDDCSLPPLPF